MHWPEDEKLMVVILRPENYEEWLTCGVDEAPKFFKQWHGPLEAFLAPLARRRAAKMLRRRRRPVLIMLVDVVQLRAKGVRLRKGELQEPVCGQLLIEDGPETATSFKRPIRVACLYRSIGVQQTLQHAVPPLFDAVVIRMEAGGSLSPAPSWPSATAAWPSMVRCGGACWPSSSAQA